MKQASILFVLSMFFMIPGKAQELSIQANNPTYLKWNQINTPSFRILFPGGFEEQAQRVANTLEHVRQAEERSMGVKPGRISILLQNQSSVSNGFVALAPRRSEFFTMPPQDYNFAGNNDWLNLLALHEYRHVVQYQRSIVGFSKFVYYLFGQQALSLFSFSAVPQWFWEGDAVATETAFSPSGRGRIPYFNLVLRTNFLEGRTFNYSKQYLRSYKHNIPDHYVLGYHMISYVRRKHHDPDIWERIARRSWAVPFIPFGFSRSVRKETGLWVEKLYREMADSLRSDWQAQADAAQKTEFEPVLNRKSRAYTDYFYPQILDDGSVVAMKTGIGDIPQLVRIAEGKEISIDPVGPWNDSGMLSVAGSKVVWNEYRFDPRWRMKTYTVIRQIDFKTGKTTELSTRSRYGSAALSPDGTKVVSVESTHAYESRIVVIDATTEAVIKIFENPSNHFISMPRWTPDGNAILFLSLSGEGKTISSVDFNSGEVKVLASMGNENAGHPVVHQDYLFYNSAFSGIDNIYALHLSTGEKFLVTSSKLGSYNPVVSADGKWIYYNEQTRDGMDVVRAAFEPARWIPIANVPPAKEELAQPLVEQEANSDILKSVPATEYPVQRYRKWKGVINPHSWGPFFNTSVTQADVGISSRDLLGTTVIDGGYTFDINERTGKYRAGLSYQGLYPILDFDFTYGKRSLLTGINQLDVKFTWNEMTMSGGVRLPFVLTRSEFSTSLTLKNSVGVTQVTDFANRVSRGNILISRGTTRQIRLDNDNTYIFDWQVGEGILLFNHATFTLAHTLRMSRRDINPKWGGQLEAELFTTPYGGDFEGSQFSARGVLYLPGIFKHHSLMLRANYQDGSGGFRTNRYAFANRVFRPRGFAYTRDTEFISLSANYTLPVWYPDFALGGWVNLQRIRANLFYDYGDSAGRVYLYRDNGEIRYSPVNKNYQSTGIEVKFDLNVMRLLPQLDVGFRVNYGLSHKQNVMFEFLFGSLNL